MHGNLKDYVKSLEDHLFKTKDLIIHELQTRSKPAADELDTFKKSVIADLKNHHEHWNREIGHLYTDSARPSVTYYNSQASTQHINIRFSEVKQELKILQESHDSTRRELVEQNSNLIRANRDLVSVVDDLKRNLGGLSDDFYQSE